MSEPLGTKQGSLFVQISPTDTPLFLDCLDLGDIPQPRGDKTLFYCRNRDGVVKAIGSTQAVPAQGTTTITVPVYAETDTIDTLVDSMCEVTLYVMTSACGKRGIFSNYTRGIVLYGVRLTNHTWQNTVMREADDKTLRVLDIAWNDSYNIRQLTVVQQTIAETRNLNDIVFDLDARCAGDCGAPKDADDIGYTVSSGSAGSPTSNADIWETDNEGATWANATGLVASPFAGGDIISAVLFQVDRDTWRLLVASGPKAGSAQIAYSDDDATTWTTVTVGATAWEGAAHADALFAFDRDHIWYATDHGRVYFSSDAGATWTSQASALTASGARSLNGVKFSDYDNGFAAGNNDTLIKTVDGGDNWAAVATVPTTSDNITGLYVFSKYMLIVGSNADGLWISLDAGVTWTSITFTGQGTTGTVNGFDFANDKVGFMIHNTTAPLGSVHYTVNGGVTWEKLTTPTNAGLNAIFAIDEHTAYAVGNAYGGTGVVLKISG